MTPEGKRPERRLLQKSKSDQQKSTYHHMIKYKEFFYEKEIPESLQIVLTGITSQQISETNIFWIIKTNNFNANFNDKTKIQTPIG